MKIKFPWKANFRSIPSSIQTTVAELDDDLVVIAATKSVTRTEIANGLYEHLGLQIDDGRILTTGSAAPQADAGQWSFRNSHGWDRKRPDWPKVTKTWTFESPNFGDGARNGWSMQSRSKEVCQHQIFEPQGMTIDSSVVDDRGGEKVTIKFELNPILSRKMPEFELMLLWSLNILQENTGVANVFSSKATHSDFIDTVSLDWQIFPAGTADQIISRLLETSQKDHIVDYERHVRERIEFFETFKPLAYIQGSGGFGSYFGAQFADDFVVFENLKYGNAVYVLYENWSEASQRSRLDLLRDQDALFDRVLHTQGWQQKLTTLLQKKLFEHGLRPRSLTMRTRRRGR
jgi:hypothetical protein